MWAVTRDDLQIYYQDVGVGEPIVFQSGYMGIHDIWKYQVEGLKGRFRCITHDNRGYGLSSKPVDLDYYTMERNAMDTNAVLEAAGILTPCVFVTHSIGAMVFTAFAKAFPEKVRAAVILNGTMFTPKPESGANEEMFSRQQRTPQESMQFYTRLGLREDIAIEAGKWQISVFRNQTRAFLNYPVDAQTLKAFDFPVLVLYGRDDPMLVYKDAPREVAQAFPRGQAVGLDGLAHFPQTQDPDTVNQMIAAFCSKL